MQVETWWKQAMDYYLLSPMWCLPRNCVLPYHGRYSLIWKWKCVNGQIEGFSITFPVEVIVTDWGEGVICSNVYLFRTWFPHRRQISSEILSRVWAERGNLCYIHNFKYPKPATSVWKLIHPQLKRKWGEKKNPTLHFPVTR